MCDDVAEMQGLVVFTYVRSCKTRGREAGDAVMRVTRRNCVVKGMNRVVQYQGRQTASEVNLAR